jgi:hypothetical protein
MDGQGRAQILREDECKFSSKEPAGPACSSGGVSPPNFCGGTPQLRSKWDFDFLRTNLQADGSYYEAKS